MSLIGGYVASSEMPLDVLRAKLRRYSSAGSAGVPEVRIAVHGSGGHLFSLGAKTGIATPQFMQDVDGNLALSVGYLRPGVAGAFEGGISTEAMTNFEGEFCLICSSHPDRTIHIVNDRFAARPLFIFQDAATVAFATDLNFLLFFLGKSPPADRLGWFEIFKYGHTLGTRTTFAGITKLEPATRIVITDGRIHRDQYWRLRHEPREGLELSDFSGRAFAAFKSGLDWREKLLPAAQRRVVPLSGGLDSRLIAGAMSRPELCTAVTRGEQGSREMRVAANVAGILGMQHERLQLENVALHSLADDLVELTAGMLPIQHPAKTLQRAAMVRQGGGFAFGGEPGDVLAGSYIPGVAYLNPANRDALLQRYGDDKGIDNRMLRRVLSRDTFARESRASRRHLGETLTAVSGPTAAHAVTAWAMMYRQPSFSFLSPYNHYDDIFQVYPHLDYHYNDLLLQLPAEWLYKERFYKAMIFLGLPALQSVPYANTGELLTGEIRQIGRLENVISWLDDGARAAVPATLLNQARRMRHRLGGGEVMGLYDYLRNDTVLISVVREVLHAGGDLGEILDVAGTDRFVSRCVAGDETNIAAASEILGAIVTLTLWYRKYYS